MKGVKLLHPHPALLISDKGRQDLVISDLHIGFEEKYAQVGVNIKGSTESLAKTLFTLLEDRRLGRLIILGDVKHSIDRIGYFEWREVPRFFEQVSERVETIIIPGNHDGALTALLPRNITLLDKPSLLISGNGLLHDHTKLPKELLPAKRLIMGHIHPVYRRKGSPLTGQPVWLLLKVKKKMLFSEAKDEELEIYILPAFNKDLSWGGFTVIGKIISPILRRVREGIREAIIVTLDGDIVGGLESIDCVM